MRIGKRMSETVLLLTTGLVLTTAPALATGWKFNDGTTEGWTIGGTNPAAGPATCPYNQTGSLYLPADATNGSSYAYIAVSETNSFVFSAQIDWNEPLTADKLTHCGIGYHATASGSPLSTPTGWFVGQATDSSATVFQDTLSTGSVETVRGNCLKSSTANPPKPAVCTLTIDYNATRRGKVVLMLHGDNYTPSDGQPIMFTYSLDIGIDPNTGTYYTINAIILGALASAPLENAYYDNVSFVSVTPTTWDFNDGTTQSWTTGGANPAKGVAACPFNGTSSLYLPADATNGPSYAYIALPGSPSNCFVASAQIDWDELVGSVYDVNRITHCGFGYHATADPNGQSTPTAWLMGDAPGSSSMLFKDTLSPSATQQSKSNCLKSSAANPPKPGVCTLIIDYNASQPGQIVLSVQGDNYTPSGGQGTSWTYTQNIGIDPATGDYYTIDSLILGALASGSAEVAYYDNVNFVRRQPAVKVAGQILWTSRNGSVDVAFSALGAPPINFVIENLPSSGTLVDVGNGNHTITAGEIPYTLPNQQTVVRYVNSGGCGQDSFRYHAYNAQSTSDTANVTINVQCGDVIMTEIMYNPASTTTSPKLQQWVEIYNTTSSDIDVSNWYLTDYSGRAGDWPAGTILPAHGVAVVVPAGSGTNLMDAVEYRTAWDGYTITQIIQPTLVNDASGKGQLTSGSLDSNPTAQQLRIMDSAQRPQDYVNYASGSPWPTRNTKSSIFLKQGNYTVAANDNPSNWALAIDCAGGAYGCAITGTDNYSFNAHDYGSPGYLVGVTPPSGTLTPSAPSMRIGVPKNGAKLITLPGCDTSPGGPLGYTITSVVMANGLLVDPGTQATISTLPYLLSGNTVQYTPNTGFTSVSATGPVYDSFTYSVSDGVKVSWTDGTITLVVQKGGLVITEVMYKPANTARNDWQYYELYNSTAHDITVKALTNGSAGYTGQMQLNVVIPAGATRVVAPGVNNGSRSMQDFLNEWTPLTDDLMVWHDASLWQKVGTDTGTLQAIDDANDLLDEVTYYAGSWPWPVSDGRASIAVRPEKLNAFDNDLVENWGLSSPGLDGAWATPETSGSPIDSDIGSPGVIPTPCPGGVCLGACCLGGSSCSDTTESACVGAWGGAGTSCATSICASVCGLPFADADYDGDVDQTDFAVFQRCFTGSGTFVLSEQVCRCFDRDDNNNVDADDMTAFESCATGPSIPIHLDSLPAGCLP
jgi:hypothetical protein